MVTSGPVSPYPEIMQGFVRMILGARRYLYLETPYFLPNDSVLFALKTAALAGVDVQVLCPRYSDARFVDWASRSYLREVTEAGVKVLLYQKGFLHSKLMVCLRTTLKVTSSFTTRDWPCASSNCSWMMRSRRCR